jgi:hypothetical protein
MSSANAAVQYTYQGNAFDHLVVQAGEQVLSDGPSPSTDFIKASFIFAEALPGNTTIDVTALSNRWRASFSERMAYQYEGIIPAIPTYTATPAWAPPLLTFTQGNNEQLWGAFFGLGDERYAINLSLTTDASGAIVEWDFGASYGSPGGSAVRNSTHLRDSAGSTSLEGYRTHYTQNNPGLWSVSEVANPLPENYVPSVPIAPAVPEPESLAMLAAGLGLLAGTRHWHRTRR